MAGKKSSTNSRTTSFNPCLKGKVTDVRLFSSATFQEWNKLFVEKQRRFARRIEIHWLLRSIWITFCYLQYDVDIMMYCPLRIR